MATTILLRRGTSVQWAAYNTVLRSGEAAIESDTGKIKVGDGLTPWNALEYFPRDIKAPQLSGSSITTSKLSPGIILDGGQAQDNEIVDDDEGGEQVIVSRRIPPIRGVNLAPWAVGTDLWEEATEELRPTHVTVPIRIETPSVTSSTVTVNASDLARAAAYDPGDSQVIIEPYPWVNNGADSETEWDPSDIVAWESNYTAALVTIAQAFPSAWGMYVGSNLVQVEEETNRWINIIDAVKANILGVRIIYRTNWWITAVWAPETMTAFEAKIQNPLFAEVDIIAVAAYFELTATPRPNQDEIADSLYATTLFERFQNVYDECRRLAQRWNKPLLFGELACAKYEGALVSPWRPWNPPDVPPPVDWMIQARYFRAVYDVFRDSDWWMGFSIYGVAYPFADGGYNLTPAASRWLSDTMRSVASG